MNTNSEKNDSLQFQTVTDRNTFVLETKLISGSKFDSGITFKENENQAFDLEPVKNVTVFDVASYILRKLGPLTTMKLHKLAYYCQAWSLVWDEEPLYHESIEAWANGPVVRELFAYHRGHYSLSSISIGNPDVLNEKQRETVDAVLDYYGAKSAQWLIELTHLEDPWKAARVGLDPTERGNQEITQAAIAEYYSAL